MKPEILKLALECGSDDCIPNEPDRDGNFYMHYIELERFYHRAQAQALREAAEWFDDGYEHSAANTTARNLRRMAAELESKK